MERRIEQYIKRAEDLAQQEGGVESLKGAVANTERLLKKGEPVSEGNLKVLKNLLSLAQRAGKNSENN